MKSFQNPAIPLEGEERKKAIARRYKEMKDAGTLADIARDFDVSFQTIYNYYAQYRDDFAKEDEAANSTGSPAATPVEDSSRADATSVPPGEKSA